MSLSFINDDLIQGTFIEFRFSELSPSGKTKVFYAISREGGNLLGRVAWLPRWRKYGFICKTQPDEELHFEEVCLQEIAEFIKTLTKSHKVNIPLTPPKRLPLPI